LASYLLIHGQYTERGMPEDDSHLFGQKIQSADALVINPQPIRAICAQLKLLFDPMFSYL
jgi:hypothetical protein